MHTTTKKATIFILALILAITIFRSLESNEPPTSNIEYPSENHDELNRHMEISRNITNLKWEIFHTPEASTFTPGPTDYVTIIITGTISNNEKISDQAILTPGYFVPPTSTRKWLNNRQSSIISSLIQEKIPSAPVRCTTRKIKSAASNKHLDGIECQENDSTIIIITISTETSSN